MTAVLRHLEASVQLREVPIRHAGLNALMRSASFEHRDHLVVPVIALVEGVLHAVNASEPELVLASEFSIAPGGWGGRIVCWDHPVIDGNRVTANSPRTSERYGIGSVFNPEVKGKQLTMEAWLDSNKEMLPESKELIRRLRAGDAVEVSVGVYVVAEKSEGVHDGKPYKAIWREIVPDHLAMLPKGAIGACSIADGCGAARTARSFFITAGGYEVVPEEKTTVNKCAKCNKEHDGECAVVPPVPRSLRERFAALLGLAKRKPEDLTSNALDDALDTALRASEPGYQGLVDVNLTTNEVIYAAAPDPDVMQFYQRSYTVGEDNSVTVNSKKTEVAPKTRYEPVEASAAEPKHAEGCPCGGQKPGDSHSEGEPMKIAQDRVKALIAKSKGAFTDADIAFLEARSEDQFKTLEGQAEPPVVDTKVADTTKAADTTVKAVDTTPKTLTEDEWLKTAPQSIQDMVNRQKALDLETRAASVKRLKDCSSFSEAELNAMPLDTLVKMNKSIPQPRATVDYSIRDAARDNDPNVIPAPRDLTAAIKAARGTKTA